MKQTQITLTLPEIEAVLLLWLPREKQRLGEATESARRKLLKARGELLAK